MKGIDCCYHQGDIDWKKAHADGIDFLLPREGWGTDCDGKGVDPKFLQNTKEALAVGVSVPGIWHFIYGINEAEARQNAACAINNLRKAGLPRETVIWCDLEYDTVENARKHRGVDLTAEMQRKMAEAFCDYCLKQGYPTGIYLNADYIENVYGRSILEKYDIWLADLTDGDPGYPCVYQQYGWHGHYDGCPVDVDEDKYIGQYTTGTAKPKGGNMPHIVYTEKQLTDILRTLASGKSSYKNEPPWNLLYYDGSGRWWADCVNLYKALFNGRSIVNPVPGSFQSDLSNTGDVTEWGLLSQCTSISTDFSKLGNQFRCLYKDGHFGGYLGFEWNEPGQGIVNSVEATPAWEDGIQFSYVQSDGRRFWAKGKSEMPGWTHHGLATPWIDYSGSKPQPTPTPTPTPVNNHLTLEQFIPYLGYVARGSEGTIVEMVQRILKDLGYYKGYLDGVCGDYTVAAITAIQKDWHAVNSKVLVDGSFGSQSFTELIK